MSFSEEQIRYMVRDELRKILEKGLMYSAESKPAQPQAPQQKQKMTPSQIAEAFPEDLRDFLTINVGDSVARISTEYVSKEKWDEMNDIAKQLGFKWVSAGKDSHWSKKQ